MKFNPIATGTLIAALFASTSAWAATVNVSYSGDFDEDTVLAEDGLPAGDYDTIGGLEDVALFQLIEGTNLFHGSIEAPHDTADVFNIEIADGFRLIGASILWGINLSPIDNPYQSTRLQGADGAPSWHVEESSVTPEIFTIDSLLNGPWGDEVATFNAPTLDVGPGIYLSTLRDNGGTCAIKNLPGSDGFLHPTCVDGIDYTMSFMVERVSTTAPVPVPASLPLLLAGVGGIAAISRRRRKIA
ncbi:VPLPA-CTERM sorting domain-containing protein [Roseovarius sp. EL26]|uniref:VPLPA-CTERM sorting domain-containing protein n=1 Tax=Roseovarius sp. EL26 TaxID=2126672 RepID=UPI000EA0E50F|nr:VPLPA-CTERM sorting domain-containing protein [Roseovarius sp. EL26]